MANKRCNLQNKRTMDADKRCNFGTNEWLNPRNFGFIVVSQNRDVAELHPRI